MKRFPMFLEWLKHSDRPPEAQSPFTASAVAAVVSLILIGWLDSHVVSSLRVWWAQLLVYAFVPVLLAFIILYRSSWHREMGPVARPLLTALFSCLVFFGALIALAFVVVLFSLTFISSFDHFARFHY